MRSIDDYFQGAPKANWPKGHTSMLNECAGSFHETKCKVMGRLRTEDRMRLR